MTSALVSITLRALLNRRRTLLLALLGGPADRRSSASIRLSDPSAERGARGHAIACSATSAIGVLLPLVAVIVGTSALGSELDDGTIVYLLARPVPRWRIVIVKLARGLGRHLRSSSHRPSLVAGIIGHGRSGAGARLRGGGGRRRARVHRDLRGAVADHVARAHHRAGVRRRLGGRSSPGSSPARARSASASTCSPIAEALGGGNAVGIAELGLAGRDRRRSSIVTAGAAILAVRRLETVELRGETT